jgi:hypothetical protein
LKQVGFFILAIGTRSRFRYGNSAANDFCAHLTTINPSVHEDRWRRLCFWLR